MAINDLGLVTDIITNITRVSGNGTAGSTDTYNIATKSGGSFSFDVVNGSNGADGKYVYKKDFDNVVNSILVANVFSFIETYKDSIIAVRVFENTPSGGRWYDAHIASVTSGSISMLIYRGDSQIPPVTYSWVGVAPSDFGNGMYALSKIQIFMYYDSEYGPFGEPDPVLENNTWEAIAYWADKGQANNIWSVGDTKTDTGYDTTVRTFRIADMQGLYGKHVVFESVYCEGTDYALGTAGSSNYSTSTMVSTTLPSVFGKYSTSLQNFITKTSVKVATSTVSSTLVTVTENLFLPAERELFSSRTYCHTTEWDALSQFGYYITNSASSYKIKNIVGTSTADSWWTRSPITQASSYVYITSSGSKSNNDAHTTYGIAPCFAR